MGTKERPAFELQMTEGAERLGVKGVKLAPADDDYERDRRLRPYGRRNGGTSIRCPQRTVLCGDHEAHAGPAGHRAGITARCGQTSAKRFDGMSE